MKIVSGVLTTLLLLASSVHASDLEEILQSTEMKRYQQQANLESDRLADEKWLPPDENFSLLFSKKDGWLHVNRWFDIPATGDFRKQDVTHRNTKQYIHTYRTYTTKDGTGLLVEVYIPHPRYRETARFGLIDKLAERSPPQLKVEFTEDTDILGNQGKLYTLPQGKCQINIPLDLETLVIFSAPCSHTDDLLEIGRSFSFDRFIMKLNT